MERSILDQPVYEVISSPVRTVGYDRSGRHPRYDDVRVAVGLVGHAGRTLLLVDGRQTLASALVNGTDATPLDRRSETGIRGEGETNSLVFLKAIFAWRLDSDTGSDSPKDKIPVIPVIHI